MSATTWSAVTDLIEALEADSKLQGVCVANFGCKLTRGLTAALSKTNSSERITTLFQIPDEWNNVLFNTPVHLYLAIDGQSSEEDHAYEIPITMPLNMVLRFESGNPAQLPKIYALKDALQKALKRHDADVIQFFNNQSIDFFYIDPEQPAIQLQVEIQFDLCVED